MSFPLIEVSGSPYERGFQHGSQAAERVRRSVGLYTKVSAELRSSGRLARHTREIHEQVAAYEPQFVEEMRGIASGAGVGYEDILMVNARTEIVALSRRDRAPQEPLAADECTSVAVLPGRSSSGQYMQGQNWDNRVACADTAIVLKIRRDDGPDLITFVEAGGLARYGMNSAGITLNGNGLESSLDFQGAGIPLSLVRRKALQQENFALALQAIVGVPKACSCNVLLGTAQGFAVNIECAPDESFLVYPEGGLAVHANHWVSTAALSKLKDTGLATMSDTVARGWRVRTLLDDKGPRLSADDLKAAFADRFDAPFSVCRPERANVHGDLSATVATLLMHPARGVMEVARQPYKGAAAFTEYRLHEGLPGGPASLQEPLSA